jgi:alpha-N-arabinofuranosidase
VYDFQDALLVGSMLITMLRHADRVKIACLAQLVNVIAPIMTSDTGAWRQTTYYPYYLTGKYGRGVALQTLVESPKYETKKFGMVDCVDCVVIDNDADGELVVFAVNKDLDEDIEVTLDLRQYAGYRILEHVILEHEDLFAVNTEADQYNVAPAQCANSRIEDGKLTAVLKKTSWNMIRLGK